MKWLRRRRVLRSCDPVFDVFKPVAKASHSPEARRHDSGRRRGDECQRWVDLIALRMKVNA